MKQRITRSRNTKLTAYSAMAAAITAAPLFTNAEVIYTDIEDVTVGVGDLLDLDVNADGIVDFRFSAGSTTGSSGTWSFASAFGIVSTADVGNSQNQFIGYSGAYYNYGSALVEGDLIGPDSPWLNYPSLSNSAVLASNFYGVTYGAFPGQGERYLGFKFSALGNVHYGWMRVVADINPAFITILDYAYEDVADQAIEAGSYTSIVGVEEFNSGVATVYAFDASVRVQLNSDLTNAQVRITTLQGATVFAAPLNDRQMTIDLQNLATGNYIVNIQSQEGYTAKQVFIN